MLRSVAVGVLLAGGVASAGGQVEGPRLEDFFTGKEVQVKMDMPGTQMGVDLNFSKGQVMDWGEYQSRLKTYGVAIHTGEVVRITQFVVKNDRIELQMNGGGFGTFGDNSSTYVAPAFVPKSRYERDLEKQLETTSDPRRRRDIQNDLDRERAHRERQDAENQNAARVASQMKAQLVADKRLQGGSRFNLRWKGSIPSDYRNPESIMKLLSEYVSFHVDRRLVPVVAPPPPRPIVEERVDPVAPQVRRGMRIEEVSSLMGRGRVLSDSVSRDGLRTQVLEYRTADSYMDVTFVEGVVVKYSIVSN